MLVGEQPAHKPRMLLLYGSLRERSFSRFATEEAARLLEAFGAETRIFNPTGLPLPDGVPANHPKIAELRELSAWSEGQVWCSPERHGTMTGIMKAQIDWIPLSIGAVRPTQGKTLAVMQVSDGSQSFNAVNQLRVLGRWMRMVTIPNQSSVAKAYEQFDEAGRRYAACQRTGVSAKAPPTRPASCAASDCPCATTATARCGLEGIVVDKGETTGVLVLRVQSRANEMFAANTAEWPKEERLLENDAVHDLTTQVLLKEAEQLVAFIRACEVSLCLHVIVSIRLARRRPALMNPRIRLSHTILRGAFLLNAALDS